MTVVALILIPALGAGVAYLAPNARLRSATLLSAALVHAILVATLWLAPGRSALAGWLVDDAFGRVVLTLVSLLFLATTHYSIGYLRVRGTGGPRGGRAFVTCLLGFLAAATLVTLSHHLALLWTGMEATTLAVAPLIFDRHDRRSLEAVWKYLVLSSVGIALALLGVFFLATSQPSSAGLPLVFGDLLRHAGQLDHAWLRAAFVFMVVGYGTKMGLAPMQSWKPDTYGEAPPLVGGLMAGALTSCAFLGLARITAICYAADLGPFVRPVLLAFGITSLVVAAAFIVGQADMRRMLAYSSVEHMGLLVLGLGLGGVGAYGAVLHTLNHGLTKGLMFLAVGNVVMATGTSAAASVRGLSRTMPGTALLLTVGLFALTGSPPFGLFLSEFAILSAAFATHHVVLACVVLALLAVIFVGMARMILDSVYAPATQTPSEPLVAAHDADRAWFLVAPGALAVLVLILGLYIPGALAAALRAAASSLGGIAP